MVCRRHHARSRYRVRHRSDHRHAGLRARLHRRRPRRLAVRLPAHRHPSAHGLHAAGDRPDRQPGGQVVAHAGRRREPGADHSRHRQPRRRAGRPALTGAACLVRPHPGAPRGHAVDAQGRPRPADRERAVGRSGALHRRPLAVRADRGHRRDRRVRARPWSAAVMRAICASRRPTSWRATASRSTWSISGWSTRSTPPSWSSR